MSNFKVYRKRNYDCDEHRWNRSSNPSKFKRRKFYKIHESSRKYDFSRKGHAVTSRFQDHSLNSSINQFHKPSHDISSNCDFISPQFQNPNFDYSRMESFEEGTTLNMNPTRDFSRNSCSVSPRSQAVPSGFQDHSLNSSRNQFHKPNHDFSRYCDFPSLRFQNPRLDYSRNESFKEVATLNMNSTCDFLRGIDSIPPRFEGAPISNLIPTNHFTEKCNSVGHRSQTRTCENPKEGIITKVNENHFLSIKCDTVLPLHQERPSEDPKEGTVVKTNEKHDFSRKYDSVLPQHQERPSENHKDGVTGEMNLKHDFPGKCKAHLTNFQAKTCENQESQFEKMDPTLGSLNKSDALSPQVEPKTSENSKEVPLQVQAKNSEFAIKVSRDNFKRRKVDAIRVFPKHCGALAPRVNVKPCETGGEVEKSEASMPSVVNSESIKSTILCDYFKKRKVNAVRQFPRFCGALAPRVTIIRCDDNSIVVKGDTYESSKISSSSSATPKKVFREERDLEEELGKVRSEYTQQILDISSESEDEDRNKVGNKPINSPEIELLSFVEQCKEACSKDEYINDSDLLSNQNKVDKSSKYGDEEDITELGDSPIDSSDSEDECYIVNCKYSDLFPNQEKRFNDLKIAPFGDSEAVSNRKEVMETLDTYCQILAELFERKVSKQVHLEAAMLLKKQKQWVNTEELLGHVPGVEIGDKFRFRGELVCIGLHRQFQSYIDYMKKDEKIIATSIVSSNGEFSDVLHYSDQDEKLVRGNLALKNSMEAKTPVRVIRKSRKSDFTYFYDGLYFVTKVTQEISHFGKFVYTFLLIRIKN